MPAARSHSSPPRPAGPGAARVTAAVGLACAAFAALQAWRYAWLCDDAYISFRYARHLVQGMGLVYNPGEHVEGYSNFLWTLWCAAGMRLGASIEGWAVAWGIAFHAVTVALLAGPAVARARVSGRVSVPLAAIAACVHEDWSIFGTSGLETPLFLALVVGAWLALAFGAPAPRRAGVAALLAAAATLTRPEGAIFAALVPAYALAFGRPRVRAALAALAVLVAVGVPYGAWKLAWFGDLMPNTWYAKSAAVAWWDQGLHYLRTYFTRYVVLLAAVPAAALALARKPTPGGGTDAPPAGRPAVTLALAFAFAHLAWVARVGGDFMYARFALPATPFLLLAIEQGANAAFPRSRLGAWGTAAAVALAIALSRYPFEGEGWVRGIVNEREYYTHPIRAAERQRRAATLRRYFDGLPVRVAFAGGEAQLAYDANPRVAIETSTGLTDSLIARQPLLARGRVGHEKRAPMRYLLEQRRVHVWTLRADEFMDSLTRYVPFVPVLFDSVPAAVLTWDPAIMEALRRRGARGPDVPSMLDGVIARLPSLPDSTVRDVWQQARRLYFDHADDPARERPFRERLGLPHAEALRHP